MTQGGLSEQVDKAVADYKASLAEELASHEAQEVRALVQGLLAGSMLRLSSENQMGVNHVHTAKDENGNYLPYFNVEMNSGIHIRVSVDVVPGCACEWDASPPNIACPVHRG